MRLRSFSSWSQRLDNPILLMKRAQRYHNQVPFSTHSPMLGHPCAYWLDEGHGGEPVLPRLALAHVAEIAVPDPGQFRCWRGESLANSSVFPRLLLDCCSIGPLLVRAPGRPAFEQGGQLTRAQFRVDGDQSAGLERPHLVLPAVNLLHHTDENPGAEQGHAVSLVVQSLPASEFLQVELGDVALIVLGRGQEAEKGIEAVLARAGVAGAQLYTMRPSAGGRSAHGGLVETFRISATPLRVLRISKPLTGLGANSGSGGGSRSGGRWQVARTRLSFLKSWQPLSLPETPRLWTAVDSGGEPFPGVELVFLQQIPEAATRPACYPK